MDDIVMVEGVTQYIYPTYSPSNANVCGGTWSTYTSSNTSVFTISEAGVITTKNYGTATLTIKDKITGVSTTASVQVTRETTSSNVVAPNPDGQNKTLWCWAAAAKMVGVHNRGLNPDITPGATVLTDTNNTHSYNGQEFTGIDEIGRITADTAQWAIVVTQSDQKDDGNHAGGDVMINNALSFVSLEGSVVGMKEITTALDPDITFMRTELAAGRWVVGILTSETTSSHAIVIKEYNTATEEYLIWDPWSVTEDWFEATDVESGEITSTYNLNAEYQLAKFHYCQ